MRVAGGGMLSGMRLQKVCYRANGIYSEVDVMCEMAHLYTFGPLEKPLKQAFLS